MTAGASVSAPPDARLAVEVVLAWADTEKRLPGRLRPCANGECRLFLLDRSRAKPRPLVLDGRLLSLIGPRRAGGRSRTDL